MEPAVAEVTLKTETSRRPIITFITRAKMFLTTPCPFFEL